MKRTEKVEIRVSQEEKQTLSELARQEGESVSGLIRGLVEKYMTLNTASTKRRLPKWQLAGLIILAAFIGHGLTLILMHLHDGGHQTAEATPPVYYVHGAINHSAFGVSVDANQRVKEFMMRVEDDRVLMVRLAFLATPEETGVMQVSICEMDNTSACRPAFDGEINVERIAPAVLGSQTKSGQPVHIFVQEMA